MKGQLKGLQDAAIMSKKQATEQSLRDAVNANPDLRQKYGDAWDAVAKARRELPPYNVERVMLEGGIGIYSDYFTIARTLVRWASESQRPNGERLPEYTDARKTAIEKQMASVAPMHPGLEEARLGESLAIMRDTLGPDHALVKKVLDGKSAPADRAKELVAGTKLGDPAVRKTLFAGGKAAIDASTDPFIVACANRRAALTRAAHEVRQ